MTSGRHVIELATSSAGGLESARSSQLIVSMVGSGTAATAETELAAPAQTVASVAIAACGDSAWQCTSAASPATRLGPITALDALPDGRVLVVESGTRILVHQEDAWSVAYETASDPRTLTHIAAVAADVAFANTHFVYVAEVSAAVDGTHSVRVIRTREVGSRLGEPATIVAGEALAHDGDPVLSVGSDGLLYLALPGDATATDPAARPGRLLRFAPDGTAAGTAAAGSATLSDIAARPTSVAWDPQGHLWIAAIGEPPGSVVTRMDPVTGARWIRQPIALSPAPSEADAGVMSLAFGASPSSNGATAAYVIADAPAALYQGVIGGSRREVLSALTRLPLGDWVPTALTLRPDGALVVAARRETGSGELRQLITLTRPRIVPIRD